MYLVMVIIKGYCHDIKESGCIFCLGMAAEIMNLLTIVMDHPG